MAATKDDLLGLPATPTATSTIASSVIEDVVDLFVDANLEEDFNVNSTDETYAISVTGAGINKGRPNHRSDDGPDGVLLRGAQQIEPVVTPKKVLPTNSHQQTTIETGVATPEVIHLSGTMQQRLAEVLVGGLHYWTSSESLMNAIDTTGARAKIKGWWENSRNGQSLGVVIVRLFNPVYVRQFMQKLKEIEIDGVFPEVFPHTMNYVQALMARYCTQDVPRPLSVYRDRLANYNSASARAATSATAALLSYPSPQLIAETLPSSWDDYCNSSISIPIPSTPNQQYGWQSSVKFKGRLDNFSAAKWRRNFYSDKTCGRGPGVSLSSWHQRGTRYQWGTLSSDLSSIYPGNSSGMIGASLGSMPSPISPSQEPIKAPPVISSEQPSPPGVSPEDIIPDCPVVCDRKKASRSESPSVWDKFTAKEEAMKRMEALAMKAIKAARAEASSGQYADAIQTLTTARSTAKYSGVYDGCTSLLKRLDATLKRIENEAYDRSKRRSCKVSSDERPRSASRQIKSSYSSRHSERARYTSHRHPSQNDRSDSTSYTRRSHRSHESKSRRRY